MPKISTEELKCMGLLQSVTRASAIDCVVDEKVTFIVQPGQMGLAIGRGGENIRKMEHLLKKQVDVAEYADNFKDFAMNLAVPAEPKSISKDNGRLVIIADSRSRYLLKSDNGKILKRMKLFLERHYGEITKVEVK